MVEPVSAVVSSFMERIRRGENTYLPDLCLIQISTPERLMLIDPLSVGKLDCFWERVVQSNRVIVVHAGREELRMCWQATKVLPQKVADLQLAAGLLGYGYPIGYASLISLVLRIRVRKGETLTNWRKRPLSPNQIHYAYDDVRYLLPMWQRMEFELKKLDRLSWLDEEIARLKQLVDVETPTVEKWRKIKGVGSLDRRKLAIVREIFAWRELKAARLNRPPRSVLRDDLIVEIARRDPQVEQDLHTLRGLGKIDYSGVVSSVALARKLDLDQCPETAERDSDTPRLQMLTSIFNAILNDLCNRKHLSSSLVCSSSDVRYLIRNYQESHVVPEDSRLIQGWRGQHLLPELLLFLAGKRGLRLNPSSYKSPFEYLDLPG